MKSILAVLVALAAAVSFAQDKAPAKSNEKSDYKLGDRLAPDTKKPAPTETYRPTRWDELVPKDWDPLKEFKSMDLNRLQDGDPEANKMLEKLRAEWNRAPTNPEMAGKRIRIPGFVVPLERDGTKIKEFLLVPYFGACIHTPPPPANQIIHAVSEKGIESRTMAPIWANGTLEVQRGETMMGTAGYRMKVLESEPYTAPQAGK